MLAALNDQLQERKLDSQYVTMLMAVWDDSNQTLQIANAGSVQPLFVAANPSVTSAPGVRTINAEGFPLGLFPNAEYEEFTLSTQPGDLIVFFSDGIVDAVNADGEMFGDERLKQLLESRDSPPHDPPSMPSSRQSRTFRPAPPTSTTRLSSSCVSSNRPTRLTKLKSCCRLRHPNHHLQNPRCHR